MTDVVEKYKPGGKVEVMLPDGTVVMGELISADFHAPPGGAMEIDFEIITEDHSKVLGATATHKDLIEGTIPKAKSVKYGDYLTGLKSVSGSFEMTLTDEGKTAFTGLDPAVPPPDLSQIEADLAALKQAGPQNKVSAMIHAGQMSPAEFAEKYMGKYGPPKKPLEDELLYLVKKLMYRAAEEVFLSSAAEIDHVVGLHQIGSQKLVIPKEHTIPVNIRITLEVST